MNPSAPIEKRILLLRHAETAAPHVFHGAESDVGLSPRGFEQAKAVAERIKAVSPDVIYSTGLKRADETARTIAAICTRPHKIHPGLHERRMGSLSGRSRTEGWPVYEQAKDHWKAGRLDFTHEGGESFAEMRLRSSAAFRELLDGESGRTIVLVAHGVINRVLIASLAESYTYADFDRIPIDFVGVHDLRWIDRKLRSAEYWPGDPPPPLDTGRAW